MGNPALEEFFGRPETIEQLANALRQASTGLQELKGTLDAEVSGLVPAGWEGQAASAFGSHWQQQSAMTAQVAQSASWMSTATRVLATELHAARSLFQSAEEAADANACYITPFYVVLPYSWWDLEAVAAMEWIQGMVVASMTMAEAARAQAAVELAAIWAEPGALSFLKDLGSGLVAGLEDLWQAAETMAMLSPQRAAVDPLGWWHDEVKYAKGMIQAVQHPGAILKKLVDWEDWTNGHPGRAIGKLAPMAIIAVATAGGGAAADAGVAGTEVAGEAGTIAAGEVVAGEATAETVGTTVTKEVVEASTVTGEEAPLAATRAVPGLSSGPPPAFEIGEIKPIGSYRAGLYQLSERGAAGNDALVTFDNAGNVHMQVFGETTPGTKTIIWEDDIGQVSPLPTAKPGSTQFGDQMEPLVRDLVSKTTGTDFNVKAPNAGGPDLVPVLK
ncbi:MAG TPA: WXG100 family type VII secretion target [Candidatus Dormibacteraeota bacterium]|nr:WXG100 family type VII secretion target [Candidatus Dormibacteraeota bacterium]